MAYRRNSSPGFSPRYVAFIELVPSGFVVTIPYLTIVSSGCWNFTKISICSMSKACLGSRILRGASKPLLELVELEVV